MKDDLQSKIGLENTLPGLEPIRPLGAGTMGSVLLARDPQLKRLVAVKLLRRELAADPVSCKRFEREAQAAARISHTNVTDIYSIGKGTDDVPFIVMEYIEGKNLADVIASHGMFSVTECQEILSQLAAALAAAHQERIIHRDIKPANILIEQNSDRVVLTDFGVAGIGETGSEAVTRLTRAGEQLGDLRYMSPEQLRGDTVTEQTDIYSFGIVAYELLTLRGPYHVEGMADPANAHLRQAPIELDRVRPEIPGQMADILKRCLAKRAEQRPPAAELARFLAAVSTDADQADAPAVDPGLPTAVAGFLEELRQREVYRVAAAYLAISFVVLEGTDLVLPALPLPRWIFTLMVATALAGFPVAVTLAWIFDYRQGRLSTTGEASPRYARQTTRSQRIALQILGLALSVGLAALLAWWLFAA